jgi:hypothetical protein
MGSAHRCGSSNSTADPGRLVQRTQRGIELKGEIRRGWDENFSVYGARKVWRQLNREAIAVARCALERIDMLDEKWPGPPYT